MNLSPETSKNESCPWWKELKIQVDDFLAKHSTELVSVCIAQEALW